MRKNLNEISGYKLAGLNIDLMSRIRKGSLSIEQLESFLQLSYEELEEKFGRKANPWFPQIESNATFYKEVFGLDINTNLSVPDAPKNFDGLLYIPQISGDTAVKAYIALFGKDSVYGNDYSKNIDAMMKSQQSRPQVPYFIKYRNTVEPDKEHLGKSYNDFCDDGNNYMIPLEGIVYALYYRWSTRNMLDVKGITHFYALDAGSVVLDMNRYDDGRLYLVWSNRDFRYSDYGPRQIFY